MAHGNDCNICNICGGILKNENGRWRCPYCGAYKSEDVSNEESILLSNAGQALRLGHFIEAEDLYEDAVGKYPKSSEAHWGLVLARYNIKFEDDFDGRKLPTCCAAVMESLLEDKDYRAALSCARVDEADYYRSQAQKIEDYRKEWAEKACKEPSYDVFLSYKDSDPENGIERTEDSREVSDLYTYLSSEKGYRVFYSRVSLKDKAGEKYEPYIYHALSTASVMIVYGSKAEYFESTWIKNEWTRYLKLMREGKKADGSLIVAYKDMSPSELPRRLAELQGLDAGSKTFYTDVARQIEKIKASPIEKSKSDSFSPQKPAQEVENARYEILDAVEQIYRKNGLQKCNSEASRFEALLQYSMLQIAKSDRDFDKKEAELIAGFALRDSLFNYMKSANSGIDSWEDLYRAPSEKQKKVLQSLSYNMEINKIKNKFAKAVGRTDDPDEADKYLDSINQNWLTILNSVISADGVRSKQETGAGCLITDVLDDARREVWKRRERIRKKASRKPLSAGAKKCIRLLIASAVLVTALGAISWRGASYCRKTSLSYREVSGGYEVYCNSDYEGGATLTIPAKRNGKNVVAVASSGFRGRAEIEGVVLPDTIRSIGKDAFSGCTNLVRISFPDGLEKIGDGAFSGTAVEAVELPDSVRSIGKNAFTDCTQLTSITLASGLQKIGDGAFSGTGLETVFLPETVKAVGDNAFGNCANLSVVRIAQDNVIPSTWAKTWNSNMTAAISFVYCCTLDYTSADESGSSTIYFDPTSVPVFPIPARQGYSFLGWLNGEIAVSDSAGKSVSSEIIDCSCTLTPGWEPKENQITFNANGGKGTMGKLTVLSDHSEKLLANQFAKEGYRFLGWSPAKDATRATHGDGAVYRMGTSSVTLYAVWEAVENRITFDSNGGNGTMDSQAILSDHSAVLLTNRFTRTGYFFIGWATAKDAREAAYGNGETYTIGTKSVTLYAVWLKNSYAITLRNDSSKNSVVITDEKPYSDAINPELDVMELARNGYTQVLITIAFDCCEIDDGYQDVEICTVSGKSLATTTVEHGSGLFASTTWGIEQCSFTISLTDLESDGAFVVKWGAHGKLDDDWKLGCTEISITVAAPK